MLICQMNQDKKDVELDLCLLPTPVRYDWYAALAIHFVAYAIDLMHLDTCNSSHRAEKPSSKELNAVKKLN